VTAFGTEDDAVSALMEETEAAIKDAEDDQGAETIDGGGWCEVVQSIVSMSDASPYVKSEVLRMHGIPASWGSGIDTDWLDS
jgi:hypothetical protein